MQYLSQDKVLRYEDSSCFIIWMRNIEKRLEAILSTFRVSQWLVMVSEGSIYQPAFGNCTRLIYCCCLRQIVTQPHLELAPVALGQLQTHDSPASASHVLGLLMDTTVPGWRHLMVVTGLDRWVLQQLVIREHGNAEHLLTSRLTSTMENQINTEGQH